MTSLRKERIWRFVRLVCLVALGGAVLSFLYFYRYFVPPIADNFMPLDHACSVLINDRKTGSRAIERIRRFGDEGLRAVQSTSVNFTKLDNRNSIWVAELLSVSDSELAVLFAEDLHNRKDKRQRLVGAVALAAHGKPYDIAFVTSMRKEHDFNFDDNKYLLRLLDKKLGDTRSGYNH